MKKYISPEMSVQQFETADVITVSNLILVITPPAENEQMTVTYADLWEKQ